MGRNGKAQSRFITVAIGVQRYKDSSGHRSYRVRCKSNGTRVQRIIPETVFAEAEVTFGYSLEEKDEILIASQIHQRLRKALLAGESIDTAWEKTCGPVRQNVAFDEFILETYLPSRVGEISNKGHDYTARKIARDFGPRPIGSISYDHIKDYLNRFKMQGLSASRIRDYTGVFSSIFTLAQRQNLVQNNPTKRKDKGERKAIWPTESSSHRAEKYAKAEEVELLIQAANFFKLNGNLVKFDPTKHRGNQTRYDTRWMGDLICFAFETGIRKGAILKLEWAQVYPPTDKMSFGYVRLRAEQVKTRESRLVPLSERAREVLDRQRVRWEELPPALQKDPRIFRGRLGQTDPSSRSAWISVLGKAKELGWDTESERLQDFHLHDLRASWCIDILSSGANVNEVQLVGGWKTLSAMNRYVSASETEMESVQSALANRHNHEEVPIPWSMNGQ